MKAGETGSVLGVSARWRGELETTEDLIIDGHFEGSIRQSKGLVTIGAHAHVRAQLSVDNLIVRGHVEGDIRSTGSVVLHAGAVVVGDVYSRRFSMESESVFRGQVDPGGTSSTQEAPRYAAAEQHLAAPSITTTDMAPVEDAAREEPQISVPVTAPLFVDTSIGAGTRSGRPLPTALAAFATGGRPKLEVASDLAGSETPGTSSWRGRAEGN